MVVYLYLYKLTSKRMQKQKLFLAAFRGFQQLNKSKNYE